MSEPSKFLDLTADIVSAFVSNNVVRATELPDIIMAVHASLQQVAQPVPEAVPVQTPTPAVSIKKSVTDDYLVCLEDGKQFKSLKRHLQTAFGMTPNEYRTKWGLPRDYPMVAPGYAAKRSALAKTMGLGRVPAAEPAAIPAPAPAPANDAVSEASSEAPAPKKRGRPSKKAA